MNITVHDTGRIALDREGDRWEILGIYSDEEFCIIARLDAPHEMIETTFRPDGRHEPWEDAWDLIGWEDEVAEELK
jgi:hypothetical protein